MAVSGTSSNRFMVEFDKNLPKGQEAGIRAYKMPAGLSKIFTFMTVVKIDNQSVVVNKKSLEKFMDRHGQSGFTCEKKSAEQLGEMLKRTTPQFKADRDSTLKMLAAMGKDEREEFKVVEGAILLKLSKLEKFLTALKNCDIVPTSDLVSKLKAAAKPDPAKPDGDKYIKISGDLVKQLQKLAEQRLAERPAAESWATKMKGETAGKKSAVHEQLDKFGFRHGAPDERVVELMRPENKFILQLVKSDPAAAKAILDKIVSGHKEQDDKTCLEGAAFALKDNAAALAVLHAIRAKAEG